MNKDNMNGLRIKDLITIGVFTALCFIFNMIGGMSFGMNPVLTFYQPAGSALLSGIIFMSLISKMAKRRTIVILAIIIYILRFATSMHRAMDLGTLVMEIIAEFIAGSKSYKSRKTNILSFRVSALGDIGTFVAYFMDPKSWSNAMVKKGTDITYIESMDAAAADWMIYVIAIGISLVALFSTFIGSKLLKKQFEKAGTI